MHLPNSSITCDITISEGKVYAPRRRRPGAEEPLALPDDFLVSPHLATQGFRATSGGRVFGFDLSQNIQ